MANDEQSTRYHPIENFTQRELTVLQLLVDGRSNQAIATELFISYTTVKWYVRQLYDKLGVHNRVQAMVRARELNLLRFLSNTGHRGETSAIDFLTHSHWDERPRHNLPASITPFVGRERELSELSELLFTPDIRLITILAPGGMGKTSLAVEAGKTQLHQFANGVYFVELTPLTAPESIVSAIAVAVDYLFQQDRRSAQQQLLDYFHEKHLLLILDNFEHLLEGANLVAEILKHAPHVKILVTSRQRLNLSSETLFILGGMDLPVCEIADTPFDYGAVKLFLQSARRVKPGFELKLDNLISTFQQMFEVIENQ